MRRMRFPACLTPARPRACLTSKSAGVPAYGDPRGTSGASTLSGLVLGGSFWPKADVGLHAPPSKLIVNFLTTRFCMVGAMRIGTRSEDYPSA